MRLDMGRSPRRWCERPLRGPGMRPAEAGHCLLPAPRGRGVERRAMGRCSGEIASQALMARSEPRDVGANSLGAPGLRPVASGASLGGESSDGEMFRRNRVASAYGAFRASGRRRKQPWGARPPPGRVWGLPWVVIAVEGDRNAVLPGGLRRDRRKGNGRRGVGDGCEARRRNANCRSRAAGSYDRKRGETRLRRKGSWRGGRARAFWWMRDRGSWIPSWTRRNAGRFRPLSESWR